MEAVLIYIKVIYLTSLLSLGFFFLASLLLNKLLKFNPLHLHLPQPSRPEAEIVRSTGLMRL